MVKNMIGNYNIPLSLYNEALKTAMYILNRISSKVVFRTPFEIIEGMETQFKSYRIVMLR